MNPKKNNSFLEGRTPSLYNKFTINKPLGVRISWQYVRVWIDTRTWEILLLWAFSIFWTLRTLFVENV